MPISDQMLGSFKIFSTMEKLSPPDFNSRPCSMCAISFSEILGISRGSSLNQSPQKAAQIIPKTPKA